MDQPHDIPDGLPQLLAALVDGQFTAQQMRELDSLLRDNLHAQRFYLQYLSTHALLCQELGACMPMPIAAETDEQEDWEAFLELGFPVQANSIAELLEEKAEADARRPTERAKEKMRLEVAEAERRRQMQKIAERKANRRPEPIVIPRAMPYVIAAAIAASLILAIPKMFPPPDEPPIALVPATDAGPPVVVATICDSVDAEWSLDGLSVLPGTTLPARPLNLTSGVVEIKLAGGAHAVFEAPVELELTSGAVVRLAQGRLVGRVPKGAEKLVIKTSTATIVDLGTEFGVAVRRDNGLTDVHVFQGTVELWPQPTADQAAAEQQPLRLEMGTSAEATSDGAVVRVDNLNAGRFIRQMSEADKNRFPFGPMPERLVPVTHDLVLWLAADGIVKRDSRGRVSVWGDLCVGANELPENAVQYVLAKQPVWIAKAIGGKPALRFNGMTTHLETKPLATTDEQTIFCVVQSDPEQVVRSFKRNNSEGLQILNYNGSPNIVVEWTAQVSLQGRSHSPSKNDLQRSVGKATGPVHKTKRPIVCGYVYSRSANRSRFYEEGQIVAEANAPEVAAITSSKFIGAHFSANRHFVGDLAEIMIFNTTLSEAEISAVSQYLMDKYGISKKKTGER